MTPACSRTFQWGEGHLLVVEQRSSVVIWGGKHTYWHKSPALRVGPSPKYGAGFYILPLCPGFMCFRCCPRKPGCSTRAEVGPNGTEITPVFTRVQTLGTERPDWFRGLMAMRGRLSLPVPSASQFVVKQPQWRPSRMAAKTA